MIKSTTRFTIVYGVRNCTFEVNSTFDIALADYGVSFDEGEFVAKKI
jgi:hypothetical protein